MPSSRRLAAGLALAVAGVVALPGAAAAGRSVAPTSCPRPSVPVPRHEPKYTGGPTELVSGLYIQGGPVPPPPCQPRPRGPYAGTLRVTSGQGSVVSRTVKNGRLAHIPLPPGRYTVQWKFSDNTARPGSFTVRVCQAEKVRQDGFLDVP
ncbi:MAG TPA: hypothetical protein VE983_08670 [Solirubrobacteraceae bacterium]|nr:hypothetical protein [Solirubrobacteraceae bacterium]